MAKALRCCRLLLLGSAQSALGHLQQQQPAQVLKLSYLVSSLGLCGMGSVAEGQAGQFWQFGSCW